MISSAFGCVVGINIRITCPCDLYPLTPHFYIVKLGFTEVYYFLIFTPKQIVGTR